MKSLFIVPQPGAGILPKRTAEAFVDGTSWSGATIVPLAGDASTRRYSRVHLGRRSAVLMDASRVPDSVAPFIRMSEHLRRLGLSVPAILERDEPSGFLLLEDFGDDTFSRLLDGGFNPARLFSLATDVLAALRRHPEPVPAGLRAYIPEKMLSDIELFLEWRTPGLSDAGQAEFQRVWREVLPLAHRVPGSLLLRDFHAANLMLLSEREGIRQVGLLDFQDAYRGPVTYDLVSLLEDARHDVPESLREQMMDRYLAQASGVDRGDFEVSMAILAAQRHTRVLAIFERLKRHEGRPEYARLHAPRVERLLRRALRHPVLAGVKRWMEHYGR